MPEEVFGVVMWVFLGSRRFRGWIFVLGLDVVGVWNVLSGVFAGETLVLSMICYF